METTRLSSKGQVIIPKAIRDANHWQVGQELIACNTGEGVLLKPKYSFPETQLEDVAGCLQYQGKPKTLDQLDGAIRQGVIEQWP